MASFRDKLNDAANSAANGSSNGVKVINMQSRANYGSLVFVPFNPADKSDSVVVLNNVMELMHHVEFKDKDTKKTVKTKKWYRLLNREDYPDLQADELDEYKDLRSMGKKLDSHRFSKSDKENKQIKSTYIRYKNYTLLLGWVIEHRDINDKLLNSNCPALLVFSSRRFDTAFNESMKAKDKKQGNSEWMVKLFNDNLKRKKYISISYRLSDKKDVIGYIANVNIEDFNDETVRYTEGNEEYLDLTKHKDKLEKLSNPISIFVGHEGRFFNAKINAKIRERFHYLLNKYCGTHYELQDGTEVEPVPTKDALGDLKKDPKELPPTDEESKVENDAWD